MRTNPLLFCLPLFGCAAHAHGTPDTSLSAASNSTIDGKTVTAAQFDAFEKTLVDRKDTIVCAETTTGGFSEYEGTDASGIRYRVKIETRNGQTLREATRKNLSP